MATSGKVITTAYTTGAGATRFLELSWERIDYNVINKTTTISWTLTAKGTYTGYISCAPFAVAIDGEDVYYSETRIKVYPEQVIATGERTISHNIDGTKTLNISVKAAIYKSYYNVSGSENFTLDIVGIATISNAPHFTDEENPTITYYNPVGNAITSLQAAISLTGANVDIPYRDIPIESGTYTFNLTDDERKTLRQATYGANTRAVRFYLRNVVEGNIYFNWKEVLFTVVNATPTIEVGVIDTNSTTTALTGDAATLIRYHSTAAASLSAYAYKEATITGVSIEHNGSRTTEYVARYPNVAGNVFTFAATDNRNNIATETVVSPMIDYVKPTANIEQEAQMDTEGNYQVNCAGNYYNDTFGYTDAAAANTLTVQYRYKTQSGDYGSWYNMTATLDGNTYTATATATGLDYRTAYVFQCRVIDKLETALSAELPVMALPVFHWSGEDFTFEVPVYFNAGANGGGSTDVEYGTWQPTLTTPAAVYTYDMRQGWYQKVGNVITIGWQLKAAIISGYNNTQIKISGCPYTPAYSAFGGGVAHNIYITGGFCFEGWSIGTDGNISARIQPCNNTTAGNLQISSTAYYPTGDVSITLAGTICYTV